MLERPAMSCITCEGLAVFVAAHAHKDAHAVRLCAARA